MKLKENVAFFACINIWVLYLLYTLIFSIIEFNNLNHTAKKLE